MTNMTLAVPEELKSVMKKHKEIKWSEIARAAMWEYAKKLELLDKLTKNSKMTQEDAIILGRQINTAIAKRHGL